MQATTRFHDGITNPILQEADFVFHQPVALHPTKGGLTTDSDGGNPTLGRVLRRGELSSTPGFLRLEARAAMPENSLAARILIQATAGWQGIACQLGHALIRGVPVIGVAQEAQVTGRVDHEAVFARVAFSLPPVRRLLRLRVFRTLDWSFGPLRTKRAEGAEASVGGVVSIAATSSAVRAGSRAWSARA
jgi:hypothetical protein